MIETSALISLKKYQQVHQDVALVAGGANFPLGVPWRPLHNGLPSPKTYYTDIYILSQHGDEQPTFKTASAHLPFPVGYGVAISYPGGVLCIGGEVSKRTCTCMCAH